MTTMQQSERKQWAREHLRGIENCIFPSFDATLEHLDEEGIRLDVRQSIAHGFVSSLLTSEAGLSLAEAKRFVEIAVDEAGSDLNVSVTLLRDTHEQNLELAAHAQSVGAHGALLGFPFTFYPQDAEEVYTATSELCEAAPELAMVLYATHKFNFGRFHPSGWPLDVLERSAALPNVVALKIGLLEPGFIEEAFARVGDSLVIQFPWERWWPLAARSFGLQFAGAGAYELFQSPEKPYLVDYFDLLLAGRFDEAKELYWRLTPVRLVFEKQFMPTQMIGTYHWPQQKYYQWLTGGNGGYTRQPVMKMVQYEMDECRGALQAIGITPTSSPDAEFFAGRSSVARGTRVGGAAGAVAS